MTMLILSLAACAYVVGGIFMKWSEGLRVLGPSAGVFLAFCLGAGLQTFAMRYETLSVGYVVVLGLEAILAVAAGVLFFHEPFPPRIGVGVVLVIVGIALLKSG